MNRDLIIRLSKYKRLLYKLKALGLEKVFSNNLGDGIGVSPALVRKDFSILHLPGNKRGGYNIKLLIERLEKVLGIEKQKNVIIAGCGKIGTALMRFEGFRQEGIKIMAGFDINPEGVQNTTSTPVYPLSQMKEFIASNNIQVGIISVPDSEAARVFEIMIESGIRGILNFASIELKYSKALPKPVIVQNVNIGLEIEHLFYQVNISETGFPLSGAVEE